MVFGILAGLASAAVSVVSTAVSSIGPAVSGFCASVLPRIVPVLSTGMQVLSAVGQIARGVLSAVGVFRPEEKIDEMGERALQGADQGVKPENYDSTGQYIQALRELKIDPEKSAQWDDIQKTVAGLAIGSKGLEEKLNMPEGAAGNLWVLATANPGYFHADRLGSLLNHTHDIASVVRYFDGQLNLSDTVRVGDTLVQAERSLAPEKPEKTILKELDQAEADFLRHAP